MNSSLLDITAIILTYNEEIHIRRCMENVNQFAKKVYIVDCFSTDRTVEIARKLGAEVVEHEWPGNQAEQFNWALDTLEINPDDLRSMRMSIWLPGLIRGIAGETARHLRGRLGPLSLSRARFCGKILHHGIVNNIKIIRLFRKGKSEIREAADGRTPVRIVGRDC